MKTNLRAKLILQFFLMGTLPAAAVGFLAFNEAKKTEEHAALNHLHSIEELKKTTVENYFQGIHDQILTFSQNKMIVDAARAFHDEFRDYVKERKLSPEDLKEMKKELSNYYTRDYSTEYKNQNPGQTPDVLARLNQLDDVGIALQHAYISANQNPLGSKHLLDSADDGTGYSRDHNEIHPIIRTYLEKFGYYDIFLVDSETGHIFYSVFKELDYATSLTNGPYANTNFARAFKAANESSNRDFVHLVDYEQYMPSYEAPASFVASPVFDGDKKIAVALFQMPIDRINQIMGTRSGMGNTGESLLVGPDKLARSDSFLDKENRNVINSFRNPEKARIDIEDVDLALQGKTGAWISKNYLNQDVLSVYAQVNVIGLKWALIAQQNTSEAFASVSQLMNYMIILCGISALITILLGFFVGRSIATPILSSASKLGHNTVNVSRASEDMAASSQTLSELSTEQASSIEETAASIEEISSMVKNNLEQAEKSSELSREVRDIAGRSNDSMDNLIASMKEITESNEKIQELVRVIGEIGEKTEVIDEIVFQTKLLSFNASVEAERAGEHGRGFAVVAQEVGNLAQMSGKASLDIASMVRESIKNAEQITSENKIRVDSGNKLVTDTAGYLHEISDRAENLHKQSEQIVLSSREQSDGVAQVNEAMSQLDQATQANSATSEKTASASVALRSQSEELRSHVDHLMLLVNGTKGDGPVASGDPAPATSEPPTVVNIHANRPVSAPSSTPEVPDLKTAVGDDSGAGSGGDGWEKL